MPTELNLADGRTIVVKERFEEVVQAARSETRLIELTPHEDESDIPRHGYEGMDDSAGRVAVNPAHIVLVTTTG